MQEIEYVLWELQIGESLASLQSGNFLKFCFSIPPAKIVYQKINWSKRQDKSNMALIELLGDNLVGKEGSVETASLDGRFIISYLADLPVSV
jgi:hypothetical protein